MLDRSWFSLADSPFDEREFSRLWLLAVLTYGVGDIVTTLALVNYSARVAEANPIMAVAVTTFGWAGLAGLKLAAFLLCFAVALEGAHEGSAVWYYAPPVALTVLGAFVTAYNLRLLIG